MQRDSSAKLFSPSYERNVEPILEALDVALAGYEDGTVLEIGSGTGQHIVDFAGAMTRFRWLPTDLAEKMSSIRAWREDAGLDNLLAPRVLDVSDPPESWPLRRVDAALTVNTFHVMPEAHVEAMVRGAAQAVRPGGLFFVYGPFRYEDRELEPSNADFDRRLKNRDLDWGLRTFEVIDKLASEVGFSLVEDRAMPANNRSIWWRLEGGQCS